MALKVTLHGAAETVTGSHFLVENEGAKIIIDCGVEQGKDYCESCAYEPFPYDLKSIDAVIITHAHLDHIGRAPRLLKEGYGGRIYMTPPTRDLGELILRDSAHILGQHAHEQKKAPLYDERDVDAFLSRVETVEYHTEVQVKDSLSFVLGNTGHILGSASVRVKDTVDGTTFAVTSDIGATPAELLPDAEPILDADVVLIESVYGDRENPEQKRRVPLLLEVLKKAVERGGAVLVPAFSMERTQLMLYEIANFYEQGMLPKVPVFLDSPLAINVTKVYRKYAREYFKKGVQAELHRDGDLFSFPFLTSTESREESDTIATTPNPKIIIAGAGMSHGGRIGRHEARYLPDPKTTLAMVGYQAPGSPGRLLSDGASSVRLDGREVKVRASVVTIHGWSGHADRNGLLEYAQKCLPRTKTFLVGIGEPSSARFLAQRIHDFLGVKAIVPRNGDTFVISKQGAVPYKV
jgi:metallo-beta-lactamase family protein